MRNLEIEKPDKEPEKEGLSFNITSFPFPFKVEAEVDIKPYQGE